MRLACILLCKVLVNLAAQTIFTELDYCFSCKQRKRLYRNCQHDEEVSFAFLFNIMLTSVMATGVMPFADKPNSSKVYFFAGASKHMCTLGSKTASLGKRRALGWYSTPRTPVSTGASIAIGAVCEGRTCIVCVMTRTL